MNASIKSYFTIILLSIIAFSCGDNTKSNEEKKTKEVSTDGAATLTVLTDSVNTVWTTMIEDDDLKLGYLKRLLDEVSYTNSYNKIKYDSLVSDLALLKKSRYNQKTMSASDKIDAYDMETTYLESQIFDFAQNHPRFEEYPLMQELINDIAGIDNQTIYHRTHYDNAAIAYNKFIDENNIDAEKKSLFQLTE